MFSAKQEHENDLLRGKAVISSEPSSNIVRVFMSSTFADMSEERNMLCNHAYPALRNYCNDFGIEFQVIDMRWGVRDTAVADHSIASLCLFEVQTCKRLSIGPYFVVLLGNRYGYQPLPSAISDRDFKILKQITDIEGIDPDGMLDTWYKLDTNCIPNVRVLEPITAHFSHYGDSRAESHAQRTEDRANWSKVYERISTILRNVESVAGKHGYSKRRIQSIFSKSITHMEVDEALRYYNGSGFFVYSRDISDIHKINAHQNMGTYIDLDKSHSQPDKIRQKMLNSLKMSVDNHGSIRKQHKKYRIKWKDVEEGKHGDYLASFCFDFVSDMKKYIAGGLGQQSQERKFGESTDSLLEEVIHHARFQYAKIIGFRGRIQLIDSIMSSIEENHNNQPILISGQSGCGKTALMGKLIQASNLRMPESTVIYRYLGTSPESSSIHELLKNLIAHISRLLKVEPPAPHLLQSFIDVTYYFDLLLQKASSIFNSSRRLLIFLDSIDQLSTEDGAHRMTWLPKFTPSGVTIVISSLPEPDFDIVPIMRKNISEANCYHVEGLTVNTAEEVMQNCLSSLKRRFTEAQTKKILEAFGNSAYPLFLKLILEEATRWRSYFNVQKLTLPTSSRDAISMFYERLEREHGTTIVSHALGYIVAARDGLTENEMLDLLSLDNDVLYEAYEHWSPPTTETVRIPAFTWTRLNHDLSIYLVRRQAGNHTVLALYHRQFIEVAREKYLNSSDAFKAYDILKEYFLGTYSSECKKKLKLNMWNGEKQVDRRVSSQPLKFSREISNVRKLRELPFCLLEGHFIDELKENVLANPEWIIVKSTAFSLKDVLEDYNTYLSKHQDLEIRLIRDAIKLAKPTLEFPGARNHLCMELYCRLKFFEQQFPRYLGALVNDSQRILEKCHKELFLPLNSAFQSPGGPLRATITGLKTPVTCLTFSKQLDTFAAGSSDGCILICDCENDETLQRIEAGSSSISAIAFSEHGDKLASYSEEGGITIFDIDTGNRRLHLHTRVTSNAKLYFAKENLLVVGDRMIFSWNLLEKRQNFEIQIDATINCSLMHQSKDGDVVFLGLSNGMHLRFCASNGKELSRTKAVCSPMRDMFERFQKDIVLVWENGRVDVIDVISQITYHSISITETKIQHCSLSESGRRLALAAEREMFLCTIQDEIKWVYLFKSQSETIRQISFIRNDHLAVAYEDRKVVVWDINGTTPKACSRWEGTGAPIDYMAIGNNTGVTASFKVFYLKVWDLKDEGLNLAQSHSLRRETTYISRNGHHLAYEENGELIVRETSDFISGNTSISSSPLERSADIVCIRFAWLDLLNLLIVYKNGLICKRSGNLTANNSLSFTDEKSLRLPLSEAESLQLCITENNEKAIIVVPTTEQNHVFCILDISTLSNQSTIIANRGEIDSEISALIVDDTDVMKVFAGTTSGDLLCIQFDTIASSVRVVSRQRRHGNSITCLALNASRKLLFTGSTGRKRRLWEITDTSIKLKHELHFESLLEGGVTTAQFAANGDYVITGSKERSITVWSTHTGTLMGTLYVYSPVLDLVVTKSNTLIYASELGYVGVAQFRAPSLKRTEKSSRSDHRQSRTCNLM